MLWTCPTYAFLFKANKSIIDFIQIIVIIIKIIINNLEEETNSRSVQIFTIFEILHNEILF